MYLIVVIKFNHQCPIFRPHHVGEHCICSWYMCICCQVAFSLGLCSTPQALFYVSLCFVFTCHAPESIGISLLFYVREAEGCPMCFLWLCLWLVISTSQNQLAGVGIPLLPVSVALDMYVCVLYCTAFITWPVFWLFLFSFCLSLLRKERLKDKV